MSLGRKRPGEAQRLPITRRGFVLLGLQLAVAGGLAWRMRQLQVIMESAQNGTDFFDAEYLERLL